MNFFGIIATLVALFSIATANPVGDSKGVVAGGSGDTGQAAASGQGQALASLCYRNEEGLIICGKGVAAGGSADTGQAAASAQGRRTHLPACVIPMKMVINSTIKSAGIIKPITIALFVHMILIMI